MANNSFVTAQDIAREALPILKNNMVMAELVHRDYAAAFSKKGDTVQVKKPPVFAAVDFDGDLAGEHQDITFGSVLVTLDTISDVTVDITSKESTLNVENFMADIGEPAMIALAQKIDTKLMALYRDIPYTAGSAGTTPDALEDFANPRKVLNLNKCPVDARSLVFDPTAGAKLGILEAIIHAEKSGTTAALRQGSMGRILGFDTYESQNIITHTKGDLATTAAITGTAGAFQATIATGGNAKTAKKGDLFTIADLTGYTFTVTEDSTTLADGSGTLKFYPALPANVSGKVITVTANHTANLAFHRSAFALVTRPLAPARGAGESFTLDFDGLAIRVTFGYDVDKKTDSVSFDCLYGVKTLYPELACRLLG
jgi:hypothetical protein